MIPVGTSHVLRAPPSATLGIQRVPICRRVFPDGCSFRHGFRSDSRPRSVAANTEAYERILGIPKGSLTIIDEPTLRFWFG